MKTVLNLQGMILSDIHWDSFKDKTVWSYCFHRLLLFPSGVFMLAGILPVSESVSKIAGLLTATPAGATTRFYLQNMM